MSQYATDDLQQALPPIESLLSKSVKAQQKLTPGTWQHSMLKDNIKALQIAHELMIKGGINPDTFTYDELQNALKTLTSMINKVEKTQVKFPPGTAQYTLQRNRLKSLFIANDTLSTFLKDNY